VPPARPLHIKLQKRIERLLETAAGSRGVDTTEFPYRPVPNLQYWFADVAYIPQADWDALPPDEYLVYAPPLIVEAVSGRSGSRTSSSQVTSDCARLLINGPVLYKPIRTPWPAAA